MNSGGLINIHPSELKFPFELKKQTSCSLQLTNKTDDYVAFKVKKSIPKKYRVRPSTGVVSPGTTCDVTVTMQAQKESLPDMQCKDKFLLQSVIVPNGTTTEDITSEMFNKEAGHIVEEFKLRVAYIPANPPSPVPEESEESASPRVSVGNNGNQNASLFDAVSKYRFHLLLGFVSGLVVLVMKKDLSKSSVVTVVTVVTIYLLVVGIVRFCQFLPSILLEHAFPPGNKFIRRYTEQAMYVHKYLCYGEPLVGARHVHHFINLARAARHGGIQYFSTGTARVESAMRYGQANLVLFPRGEEEWVQYLVLLAREKGIRYFFMEPHDFMNVVDLPTVDSLCFCIKDRSFSLRDAVNPKHVVWPGVKMAYSLIANDLEKRHENASVSCTPNHRW